MKISSVFHGLTLFMVMIILNTAFVALVESNSVGAQAAADAVADANQDVNKPLWFGTGCLLPGLIFVPLPNWYSYLLTPVGLTGTYFYQPSPPLSRLVGKSMEYVAVYTQTYKSKRGNIQARWASAGCVTGSVILVWSVQGHLFLLLPQ